MTTIRNYIPGEHLPWTAEELGWHPSAFNPQTVWIVFHNGQIDGILIAAQMMNSLLLVRLLNRGKGVPWLRALWREVLFVCDNLHIAGFWVWTDNQSKLEMKLSKLLRRPESGAKETSVTSKQTTLIVGRF